MSIRGCFSSIELFPVSSYWVFQSSESIEKAAGSALFLNTVNMAKSIPTCDRLTIQKEFAAFMTGVRTKKVLHGPVSKIAWFSMELDRFLVPCPLMFPKEDQFLLFYGHHNGILYVLRVKRLNSVLSVSACRFINSLKFDNVTLGM